MADIQVEVVFARADRQQLTQVTLAEGATVAEAIVESCIARQFPDDDLDVLQVGVWGRPVARTHVLSDGDRVELYRELELDPREARRQLALSGKTMGSAAKD
ncbi:MAG: RnfH family protein [Gammaproteobacteria bacterium]|nr:RnfH family protein [Gammaproteobacteria bacterium]